MSDIESIRRAVASAAAHYPIRRVDLFGSYAGGTARRGSDVDLLVEFSEQPVSLLKI